MRDFCCCGCKDRRPRMATPTPTPTRQAVETYMSITGASESLALHKLEEHGGDLVQAVNAHFTEGIAPAENPPAPVSPFYSSMGASSHSHTGQSGILPILSAVRSFKPSSLLDPNYRRNFFNQIGASAFRNSSPVGSPVSNVGVTDLSDMRDHPGFRPLLHPDYRAGTYNASLYENYAEEHMIQAAIEASKQEASSRPGFRQEQFLKEEEELNHAIALSLMASELEKLNLAHETNGQELGTPSASNNSEDKQEGSSKQSERRHVTRADSLPEEPASDDENTINLIVRMPDGSRHGRRFLKSNKLQYLFNFIDIGGWAEPGSYRLIAPYPRRAFSAQDCSLTLSELGLTSKQEALFLELI